MKIIFRSLLVAGATCLVALSCGELPSYPNGIAYISPVILPSPAVAAGDQLRDSTGAVVPLRVLAYDKDNNLLPGVTATFVLATTPYQATIDANGILTAKDTVSTVSIVGQVAGTLQTSPIVLQIVPQPDSIKQDTTVDSLTNCALSGPLRVVVSGARGTARPVIPGIIVRYGITRVNGAASVDSNLFKLLDAPSGNPMRADPRLAVDTTTTSGQAKRYLLACTDPTKVVVTSVEVQATATNLRGVPLTGSPVVFAIPAKH